VTEIQDRRKPIIANTGTRSIPYAIHALARKIVQLSVDEDDEQLLTSATLLRLSNANSVDVQHRYQLKWVMICEPAPVKCKKRKER
jgi:hypothetical protein